MEITITQFKHCDLVKVIGRIDSATSPKFAEALDSIINEGRHKIVLDMEEVEFMSSAGLRVLIGAQKACRRYNRGEVALALVPQRVYEAMDLAGFIPLFSFYDDITSAVGSF